MKKFAQSEIRFATSTDIESIRVFLRDNWSANHVFVQTPELLEWQHDCSNCELAPISFVVAENKHKMLEGILGFLPFRRFDRNGCGTEVSLALWKVTDAAGAGTGVALLRHLSEKLRPSLIIVIGINEAVTDLYKLLGFDTGLMSQSILMNLNWKGGTPLLKGVSGLSGVQCADSTRFTADPILLPAGTRKELEAIDSLGRRYTPVKTANYLMGRFVEHPYYKYESVGLYDSGELMAVVVWRVINSQGSRLLRIVDFIGDFPTAVEYRAAVGASLQLQAIRHNVEYIEFMSAGIDDDCLQQVGFASTKSNPDLVVPNYFEPFVGKKVEVRMAFQIRQGSSKKAVRFFRADSDQDRPNLSSVVLEKHGGHLGNPSV